MELKFREDILEELKDFNIHNEISLEDIEYIEVLLQKQPKVEPPENLFNNIIEAIGNKRNNTIITEEQNYKKENIYEAMAQLLFSVRHQISLLDKNFWFISISIILLGFFLILKNQMNILILLAPPITGYSIYYLYRGVYYNTCEIEAACKYSIYEITLARTIIIVGYNILFACGLTAINSMVRGTNLWAAIIVTWLSPLLMSYSICLYFLYRKGIAASTLSNIAIWIGYIYMYNKFSGHGFYAYNAAMWLNINLYLIGISCVILVFLLRGMRRIYR